MKKTLKIFIVGLMLFSVSLAFFGCVAKPRFDYETLKNEVVKIEIKSSVYPPDETESEMLYTLADYETNDFLQKLSLLKFENIWFRTELPYYGKYYIKLFYKNGDYQIILNNSTFNYDSNGKRTSGKSWSCPKEDFDNLIAKFINIS